MAIMELLVIMAIMIAGKGKGITPPPKHNFYLTKLDLTQMLVEFEQNSHNLT